MNVIEIEKTGTITRVYVGVAALDDESMYDAARLAEDETGLGVIDVIGWIENNTVEVHLT